MGNGVEQRTQFFSPGGLATPQAGVGQRLGGPSSWRVVSDWIRKPQSMQATAPGLRSEPHAGHFVGAPFCAVGAGAGGGDAGGGADGFGIGPDEPTPAATGCGAGAPPMMNTC